MGTGLKLHTLRASPNNMKVRIALGVKGLEFESIHLPLGEDYPGDRSGIVAISRQPLTPVLVHGEAVIFDSGAILRYLESNFPDTPPIFHPAPKTMWKIERFEWMARTELAEPIGMIFKEAFSPEPDPENCRKASVLIHERTEAIENQLGRTPYVLGDRITAADITAVPCIHYAMLPEGANSRGPIARFFLENLRLGDGRERTRKWVRKVMAHDPQATR